MLMAARVSLVRSVLGGLSVPGTGVLIHVRPMTCMQVVHYIVSCSSMCLAVIDV